MNGRIWVESEPMLGSQFHVELELGTTGAKADERAYPDLTVGIITESSATRSILGDLLKRWQVTTNTLYKRDLLAQDSNPPPDIIIYDNGHESRIPGTLPGGTCGTILLVDTGLDYGVRTSVSDCERILMTPVSHADLADALDELLQPGSSTQQPSDTRTENDADAKSLRVLVAEDNEINCELAVALLTLAGHQPEVAVNGSDAVEKWAAGKHDVILMDLHMPALDGIGATKTIRFREKDTGEHIHIIAVTASAVKGERERCLAAGMDDYLAKPIDESELHRKLAAVHPRESIEPPTYQPLDLDPALYRKLAAVFLRNSDQMLNTIRVAIDGGEPRAIEDSAHQLKGALLHFSRQSATQIAAQIEEDGRKGRLNKDRLSAEFQKLENEVRALMDELSA